MSFAQSAFAQFMASPLGRTFRVVLGVILIAWGYNLRAGTGGIVLMIVGLVPLLAGVLDLCLIGPLVGGPISGARIRESKPKA